MFPESSSVWAFLLAEVQVTSFPDRNASDKTPPLIISPWGRVFTFSKLDFGQVIIRAKIPNITTPPITDNLFLFIPPLLYQKILFITNPLFGCHYQNMPPPGFTSVVFNTV
jgi:hypothetical protein